MYGCLLTVYSSISPTRFYSYSNPLSIRVLFQQKNYSVSTINTRPLTSLLDYVCRPAICVFLFLSLSSFFEPKRVPLDDCYLQNTKHFRGNWRIYFLIQHGLLRKNFCISTSFSTPSTYICEPIISQKTRRRFFGRIHQSTDVSQQWPMSHLNSKPFNGCL